MKYIFFDYDGTLSSHKDYQLHEHTVESLKKCKENGNMIFLCTGRAPRFIFDAILPRIPFDGFISCGGNYVYLNNECIDDNSIDAELLKNTIRTMNENDIHYRLETKFKNYQTQGAKDFWDKMEQIRFKETPDQENANRMFTKFTLIDKDFDISNLKVGKIGFVCLDKNKFLSLTHKFSDYFINFPPSKDESYVAGEFTLKSCSKAHGMQVLLDAVNGKQEDTIAFGDGGNDYPMIDFANIGVVHENASHSLKSMANLIFEDEADDGITKALKQLELI